MKLNRWTSPVTPLALLAAGALASAACTGNSDDTTSSTKARAEGTPVAAAATGSPVALPATCLDNAKILLVNGSGQTAQSFQNEFTQIQSYLAELNLSATLLQEPAAGLTPANLQGFNLVIYDDAGYPWRNQASITTLQGAVNAGTPVFLFGDDISWGPTNGQPASRFSGLPQLTRLTNPYEQNLPFWNGQTDGPQLVSVASVTHPVLKTAACSVTNFTYQRDIDRTTNAPATAGETILATARGGQRTIVAYEAPSGARTLTADVALVSAEETVSDAAGLASLKCLFQNAIRWLACPPPSSPDRDKDGVPDASDACPDVAGVASTDPAKNGCPLPPADRDGDGVPDTSDACPDVAGVASTDPAKNGCPVPTGPAACSPEDVAAKKAQLCDAFDQAVRAKLGFDASSPTLGYTAENYQLLFAPVPDENGETFADLAGRESATRIKAGQKLVDCAQMDALPDNDFLRDVDGDHADVHFGPGGYKGNAAPSTFFKTNKGEGSTKTYLFGIASEVLVQSKASLASCGLDATIDGWYLGLSQYLLKAYGSHYSPLVLDLDNDGIHLSSLAQGVLFDLSGTGHPVRTAWTDGKDALLVLDRNGNGVVDGGAELFGTASAGKSHADGFEALRELDSNGDGFFDAADPAFSQTQLWLDSNRDGQSTSNELITLAEGGVKRIPVAETLIHQTLFSSALDTHGNSTPLTASFERSNGTRGQIVDAFFFVASSKKLANVCFWSEVCLGIHNPKELRSFFDKP